MPARRIGSYNNLSPQQERTVDPFHSFNSDDINRLTRIISNGSDGVVFGLDLTTNRRIPDSIISKDILKTGTKCLFRADEWEFIGKCVPELISDDRYITGCNIIGVDSIGVHEIIFNLDVSKHLPINYINSEFKFNFRLKITSGSPYKVIASVLDSQYSIEYPRNYGSTCELSVIHKITKEYKSIPLKLSFVLNPEDLNSGTYVDAYTQKPDHYDGQSDIHIDNIEYSYNIISTAKKSTIYEHINDTYDGNYSISKIHPSNKIYVTPGLAIKDDVVIQEKEMNQNFLSPCITLDVGKGSSWIKNNPFKDVDFYLEGASQIAYILNRQETGILTSGGVANGDLKFEITEDSFITTIDDVELNSFDYEIPSDKYTISENTIGGTEYKLVVQDFEIESNTNLYGQILFIVSKKTNKIISQIQINPVRSNDRLSYPQTSFIFKKTTFPITFSDENVKDKIKIVVSSGPIKVPGNIQEYNTNMVKWANVVLYYTYFKHPEPNKSYIGLIRDEDLNDPIFNEDYLVLGRVRFIAPNKIDLISYENRQNIYYFREIAKHISYRDQLDPIDQINWTDPDTSEIDIPEDVSSAITKLANMINSVRDSIPDPSAYEDDVVFNVPEYLEEGKLVQYVKDEPDSDTGHLRSTLGIDTTESGLGSDDNSIPTSGAVKAELGKKADLENGKIPQSQLPSYVDDVLEFPTLDDFPETGDSGKIYVTLDTNLTYRWSGTTYVEISKSLAIGETSNTAFAGDRGLQCEQNIDEHETEIEELKHRIFVPGGEKGEILYSGGKDQDSEFDTIIQTNFYICETTKQSDKCLSDPDVSKAGNFVIDLQQDKSYEFDGVKWNLIGNASNTLEPGREYYNSVTKSIYWCDLDKNITKIDNSIPGRNGQVVFHTPDTISDTHCDWIMNDFKKVYTCKTKDDLDKCMAPNVIAPTLKQLHESYSKFGHCILNFNGTSYSATDWIPNNTTQFIKSQYGKDPNYKGEATTFYWSNSLNSMTTSANTIDYCGFVTKNKYDEYDITYRYFSNSGDDDWAAFVAAFAEDSDGIQHTLSFIRTPNNGNPANGKQVPHWFVCIDKYSFHMPEWLGYTDQNNFFGQKVLENGSSKVTSDASGNWNTMGGNNGGVKIRVTRNGNVFKGYTSYFIQNAIEAGDIVEDTEIIIDLNSLLNDIRFEKYWNVLKLFTEECQYGFATQSQPGMAFECLSVINYDYVILDFVNNRVLTYNYGLQEWVEVDKTILDFYKYGQFTYNLLTKKLFWCHENGEITELNNTSVSSLEQIYPVGSIYIGTQAECPFKDIFGTWSKISEGKCLWGSDSTHAVGTSITAGLPKPTITAKSQWRYVSGGGGAEYTIHGGTGNSGAGALKDNNVVVTTATVNDDSIYGKSTTVQPPAFCVNIWQRTA